MDQNSTIGAQNVYITISGCRSLSQSPGTETIYSSWAWSKTLDLPFEFRGYLSNFRRYTDKYFSSSGYYRYFRLSVAVAITFRHFLRALYGRKSQICRWNFNRLIVLEIFSVQAAIYDCRSLLGSPRDTLFELSVVENLRFTVGILTMCVILSGI